jgi:hypothetical protein
LTTVKQFILRKFRALIPRWLEESVEQGKTIPLVGNHEILFVLSMLGDNSAMSSWLRNGGNQFLEELGIDYAAYLNGLGEAAGELRRYSLDIIRHEDSAKVERVLDAMDDIYSLLVTVDFPDAILGAYAARGHGARRPGEDPKRPDPGYGPERPGKPAGRFRR